MNIIERYRKWKAERPIRQQKIRCERANHNWVDIENNRIQCKDPGCGRYLR